MDPGAQSMGPVRCLYHAYRSDRDAVLPAAAQNKVVVKTGHHAIIPLGIKDSCCEPVGVFEATNIPSGLLCSRTLF